MLFAAYSNNVLEFATFERVGNVENCPPLVPHDPFNGRIYPIRTSTVQWGTELELFLVSILLCNILKCVIIRFRKYNTLVM